MRTPTANQVHSIARYVTFRLRQEVYGLSVLDVREVLQVPAITQVPHAPSHVAGLIQVRGTIVPIVDLAQRFHLAAAPRTEKSAILVVAPTDDPVFGVLVDEVLDLQPVSLDCTQTPNTALPTRFLAGLGSAGDQAVLLLDLLSSSQDLLSAPAQNGSFG